MIKKHELFLFDIDGTLVSTGGAGTNAMNKAFFSVFGIKNALNNYFLPGKTDLQIINNIVNTYLKRQNIEPDDYKKFFSIYLNELKNGVNIKYDYVVFNGVFEILSFLKTRKNSYLGLATGNIKQGAKIKLNPANLWDYFSFGGFGEDGMTRVEMLRKATERGRKLFSLDNEKELKVYIIGDSHNDILAAKDAGFVSVAVSTGFQDYDLLKSYQPDILLSRIDDLKHFIV